MIKHRLLYCGKSERIFCDEWFFKIGRRKLGRDALTKTYFVSTWGGDAGSIKSFFTAVAYFLFGLSHGAFRPLVFPLATYCFCPLHLVIDNFQRIKIFYYENR